MVTFAFGDHLLDIDRRELRHGPSPVTIEPQVFDILVYLIRNRGRVVSKNDLIEAIWGGRAVSESALTTRLNAVRKAIGDSGAAQRLVRTIPRRGVRFVGEVTEDDVSEPIPPPPASPDKPSLAVLPFTNMSGDPEQDYFADGMAEDIITALSRAGWFFVIARNASFEYKGRATDIKKIGRDLAVRYVLEGSVRKAGGRVRITCQLIEAATGRHIWADRFESGLAEMFQLQDGITERVVGAVEPSLQTAEIHRAEEKPVENLDAYDWYLRALPHFYAFTRPGLDIAVTLLRQSLGIDPAYARAKGVLAWVYVCRHSRGWNMQDEPAEAVSLARDVLNSVDSEALRCAAHALSYFEGDHPAAFTALHRALRLHPNSAHVLNTIGCVHCMAGDPEPAIGYLERAIRLSPLDKEIGLMLTALGVAHLLLGRNAQALPHLRRAVQETPSLVTGRKHLVLALFRLGHSEEARAVAAKLLLSRPDYRVGESATQLSNQAYAAELRRTLLEAGLPE